MSRTSITINYRPVFITHQYNPQSPQKKVSCPTNRSSTYLIVFSLHDFLIQHKSTTVTPFIQKSQAISVSPILFSALVLLSNPPQTD